LGEWDGVDEIRLEAWDPAKFAEGVMAIAVQDVVQSNEQAPVGPSLRNASQVGN
jgi:hypothetical protein